MNSKHRNTYGFIFFFLKKVYSDEIQNILLVTIQIDYISNLNELNLLPKENKYISINKKVKGGIKSIKPIRYIRTHTKLRHVSEDCSASLALSVSL